MRESEPILQQQVGEVTVILRSVLLEPPVDDPGYDFHFDEAFVVETIDWLVGIKATYEDYETALDRYQSEVRYYATSIAKKALRLKP